MVLNIHQAFAIQRKSHFQSVTSATGRVGKTLRLDLNGKQKRVQMGSAVKKDAFKSNQEEDLPAPPREQTSKQSISLQKSFA